MFRSGFRSPRPPRRRLKVLTCLLRVASVTALVLGLGLSSCDRPPSSATTRADNVEEVIVTNPVYYFEIPVTDLDRAIRFYSSVFDFELTRQNVDGYDMALLPRTDSAPGASGALAVGDVYVPSRNGPIIYFDVDDIDATLERALTQGAIVLYPKKHIGEAGYVAEIQDSEGNRIALHAVSD
jgi:predicted enzyme related to lactoylglutathione lyase